jgi:hypothetical protein
VPKGATLVVAGCAALGPDRIGLVRSRHAGTAATAKFAPC